MARRPRYYMSTEYDDETEVAAASRLMALLQGAMGLPVHSPSGPKGIERLRRAAQKPAEQLAVLQPLSGPALLLLRLLSDAQPVPGVAILSEEARRLLGAEGATAALKELRKHGLVMTGGAAPVGLPSDIGQLLRGLLPPLDTPVALDAPPAAAPAQTPAQRVHFELAVLVLALWTLRPKVTQEGRLYKKDEERLAALLGAGFPFAARLALLRGFGGGVHEGVLGFPVQEVQPLGEVTELELLQRMTDEFVSNRFALQALALLRGAPPGAWYSREALLRGLRLALIQGHYWAPDARTLAMIAERELEELLRLPVLEAHKARGETYYRLWPALLSAEAPAPPATARPARVHLQPSFEVLVPPEVPAAVLLSLGRLCELKRVDQVLTLQVSRAPVVQAAEHGMSAELMLRILGEAAHAGVPQNVEAQVRSWAQQAGQALFMEGLVLTLRPDADALVQKDGALRTLLTAVRPGLYLVNGANAAPVRKRLEALGVVPRKDVLSAESEPPSVASEWVPWRARAQRGAPGHAALEAPVRAARRSGPPEPPPQQPFMLK